MQPATADGPSQAVPGGGRFWHTEARVRFGCAGEGYAISRIDLLTEAEVPGVDEGLFLEKAEAAKRNCAVSKALASVEEINLEAKLVEHAG